MKRTTIFVPESLERDLQLQARRERKPVASLVREALAEYLATRQASSVVPSFTGIGRSGRTDTANRHEGLLWTEPHGDEAAPRPAGKRRPAPRRTRRR